MKITEVIRHKDINENPDSITNYNNLFRYRDVINWNDKGSYGFGYVDGEMFVTDEGKTHDSVRDDKGRKLRRAHYEYAGRIWTFDKIISFWQYPPPDMIHKVIGDLRKKLHVNVNNTYKIETLPNKVTDIDRFKGNRDWDKAYHDEIGKPVFLTPTEYSKLSNVKQLSPADRAKQHSLSPLLKGKRQGTPKIPIPIQQKYKQTAEGKVNIKLIIKEEIHKFLIEWNDPNSDWIYDLYEQRDEIMRDTINNIMTKPLNTKQQWSVVPAPRLKKVWEDAAKMGIVNDTQGLQIIQDRMIRNLIKLDINTELTGHMQGYPDDMIEDQGYTREQFEKRLAADNYEYFIDPTNGQLRISDFALKPLWKYAEQAIHATDPIKKIQYLDQMLNIVHQRSEIAAIFVQGGDNTLSDLAGYENREWEIHRPM